jgi:ketosteroid isomerase-like protein
MQTPVTQTTHLARIQAAYDGFMQGDLEPMFEILTEDVLWNVHSHPDVPFHGVWHGHIGVKESLIRVEAVDMQRFDVDSIGFVGDRVVVLLQVRFVTRNGLTVEGPFVHILTFEGDKISRVDLFDSSADLFGGRGRF